jgi:GTP 3',8-cyclase
MINEDIYKLTSGVRTLAENVEYTYSKVAQKHRFRHLFEPLRLLQQQDFISAYLKGENPFPKSIEIDPTNACNHDCPFCIYSSMHQKGRRERIPAADLFRIIKEAKSLNCESILFIGGGEPLVNPDTVAAIKLAGSLGLSCGLVTNGALLRPGIAEALKQNCTYIRVSLDAGTPETHSYMHKSNDFERILSNLEYLAKANGKSTLGVSYFISEHNFHEIPMVTQHIRDIGLDYIQFKSYSGVKFPEMYYRLLLENLSLALEHATESFDIHIMANIFSQDTHQVRGYHKCHWQAFKTIINADGNMYLCTQRRGKSDSVIGNIYNNSLSEIWDGVLRSDVINNLLLQECPFCVHHQQNQIVDFYATNSMSKNKFY